MKITRLDFLIFTIFCFDLLLKGFVSNENILIIRAFLVIFSILIMIFLSICYDNSLLELEIVNYIQVKLIVI